MSSIDPPVDKPPARDRRAIVVLLVDDQRFVRLVLERLLATESDIELHWCAEAADAIPRASQLRPTLILQDLTLPGTDGLTMVARFRANPATADTPVVVLSGHDNAQVRATAMACGACDYVVKMPNKQDLLTCIRRHSISPRHPVVLQH